MVAQIWELFSKVQAHIFTNVKSVQCQLRSFQAAKGNLLIQDALANDWFYYLLYEIPPLLVILILREI